MEEATKRLKGATHVSEPPRPVVIERCVSNFLVYSGAGILHSVTIGNGGCCRVGIRDGKRMLFLMPFPFPGSFALRAGFNEALIVDMVGEMAAHLEVTYRPAKPRRGGAGWRGEGAPGGLRISPPMLVS